MNALEADAAAGDGFLFSFGVQQGLFFHVGKSRLRKVIQLQPEALELYRNYQKMYLECKERCAAQRGPMNHLMPGTGEEYRWLDDPWPWEYCANKEV